MRLHAAIQAGDHDSALEVLEADAGTAHIRGPDENFAIHYACQQVMAAVPGVMCYMGRFKHSNQLVAFSALDA